MAILAIVLLIVGMYLLIFGSVSRDGSRFTAFMIGLTFVILAILYTVYSLDFN